MPEFSFVSWVSDPARHAALVRSAQGLDAEFIAVGQEHASMASAYNAGTDQARGRFLVYVHQDVEILDTEFAQKVRRAFARTDIGFVGPIGSVTNERKRLWFDEPSSSWRGWIVEKNVLALGRPYNGLARSLDGHLMIAERRMTFPEWLPGLHCLDSFMCLHAERQGLTNWIAPLVVRHWSSGDVGSPDIEMNRRRVMLHLEGEDADERDGLAEYDGTGLTVVIAVWNELEHTKRCLETLLADVPQAEVVVVDNGSDDGTAEFLADHPGLRHVRNDANLGVAKAWNQGLALSGRPLLCVLNNDVSVRPRGMRRLAREARRGGLAALCGGRLRGGTFTFAGRTEDPDAAHYAEGCALAFTRDTWERVGEFDERFSPAYSEDADWGLRCRLAGVEWTFVPEAIDHARSATSRHLDGRRAICEANERRLREKHADDPRVAEILRS